MSDWSRKPISRSARDRWKKPGGRRGPARIWLGGVLLLGALGAAFHGVGAAARPDRLASAGAQSEVADLTRQVADLKGKLTVNQLKLDRLGEVTQYSSAYRVPADVARLIYDVSLAEGIHPSLGFQLVKVESGFRAHARSATGALGYTQVLLSTARGERPGITEAELLRPETNLHVGFRILKNLLGQFENDLELALKAYTLGPTGAVATLADTTAQDGQAYARAVMRGLRKLNKGQGSGS